MRSVSRNIGRFLGDRVARVRSRRFSDMFMGSVFKSGHFEFLGGTIEDWRRRHCSLVRIESLHDFFRLSGGL